MNIILKDKIANKHKENYNKIINNSKFKDILSHKANTDRNIIKRIKLLNKLKKSLTFLEIAGFIGISLLILSVIKEYSLNDISYSLRDYAVITFYIFSSITIIPGMSLAIRLMIPDLFCKRKGKLFDFKEEELLEISNKLTEEEMKDLLIFIENNRDSTILRSIDFKTSKEEKILIKENNRNLLVEHIYNIKDKKDEKWE